MNVVRTYPTRAAAGRRCVWILLAVPLVVSGQESPPKRDAPDDQMKEVIITGSPAGRRTHQRWQPPTVVGSQAFDERGFTDVGQALSEVPGFGVQPSSSVNTQSAFGIAQSFV